MRLPKITGFIEGTIDSSALGDLVDAGLPNITGITGGQYIRNGSYDAQGIGALVNGNTIPAAIGAGDGWWATQLDFDASQSNFIYGNSTTVQPQSIKVFYYIVIATTTKTDIEVDIDEIVTDLNAKANDTNVVHKTGDETITGIKTFDHYLLLKKAFNDFSITPQDPLYTEIRNIDINGNEIGQFRVWKDTDGANIIDLFGRYQDNSVNFYGVALGVKSYSDGRSFTYAPASDVNNSIVTTTGISKTDNGYVKLGNGIIIQWGGISSSSYNNQLTITFPTSFSNNQYKIILTQEYDNTGEYNANAYVRSKTNTSCNILGQTSYMAYIAIGY